MKSESAEKGGENDLLEAWACAMNLPGKLLVIRGQMACHELCSSVIQPSQARMSATLGGLMKTFWRCEGYRRVLLQREGRAHRAPCLLKWQIVR